jgi:uncharacterized protein (DUF433 family)
VYGGKGYIVGDLVAFTPDHVRRLTGLSIRQLYYWDKTGFFSPEYADEDCRHPFSRIYSFRDVVSLRTLALLRSKHHVSLQELRKASQWLKLSYDTPWSRLTLYVRGREVFFQDPDACDVKSVSKVGQITFPIEIEEVVRDVRREASRLRERAPDQIGQIARHRFVVHNAAVVAGTRIPTSAIYNFHRAGYSVEAIISEYPSLTSDDVRAAIMHHEQQNRERAG